MASVHELRQGTMPKAPTEIETLDCWPIASSMENFALLRDCNILLSILIIMVIGTEQYRHGIFLADAIVLGLILIGFMFSIGSKLWFRKWYSLICYSLLLLLSLFALWVTDLRVSDFLVGSDYWVVPILALLTFFIPFLRDLLIILCFFGTLFAILEFNGREVASHAAAVNMYATPIVVSNLWLLAWRARIRPETQLSKRSLNLNVGRFRQVIGRNPFVLIWVLCGVSVFIGGSVVCIRLDLPGAAWVIVTGIGTFIATSGVRKTISVTMASEQLTSKSTVLLRSFASDEVKVPDGIGLVSLSLLVGLSEKQTIESSVIRVFGKERFVVLGDPIGGFDPFGAERIVSDGVDWREDVTRLIVQTDHVLVSVSDKAGTKWEISKVFNSSREQNTIFFRCDFSEFRFADIEDCFAGILPNLRYKFAEKFDALSESKRAFAFTILAGVPKIYTSKFANSEDFEALFMAILWERGERPC